MRFDRNIVVNDIITVVRSHAILVGDHIAPPEAGWSGGQPGRGTFRAYTAVFLTQGSFTASVFCTDCYDARVTFQMRCFGSNREQVEDMAAKVRGILHGHRMKIEGWSPQPIECQNMGPVDRLDDTEPKGWRVSDSYTAICYPSR